MAYNKVIYGGQTLVDLTNDDVTSADVRSGVYFTGADGVRSQGTLASTSVPTADTIAEWDSDAHMNSEDMTSQEVDDFVDGLNVSGINAVDYVVEQDTDGIWTYRKWNSGIAECWGTYEFASASFSATGQVYYRVIGAISFPSGLFVALPHIECSVQMGNPGGCSISNRSTSSVTIGVLSSVSAARSGNIFIKVIGTWK